MADLKISDLPALAGADLIAGDLLVAVNNSETKKLTVADLVANGVTLISDATIPGAKILFADGGIATAKVADLAITTAKVGDDQITAAKLANESTVDLVTTLPGTGAFTGQLALDTDDNNLYCWNGSAWLSLKAAGSINAVTGSTVGLVDIVVTTTGSSVAIAATQNDTDAANKFLAGPTSAGGAVAYRVIDGSDIPVATTSAKGGVIVNGEGLRMDSNTIEVDNDVSASATHHVVTYNAKGLITGGRAITSADMPAATSSAKGAVIPGTGLAVDGSGNLNHSNTVAAGTYTKVTVDGQGHVATGATLDAADIPDISAAKLTSGTIGSAIIATDAVTAEKLADQSVTKFGGAGATDNVVTFPAGDYKGQFFFDEKNEDLYVFTGESFLPITVISGNLVNAGTYNANTNLVASVTTAGSAAGFTAGGALPNPATGNLNYYVVVSDAGTGSGNAPAVSLAPPDMLISLGSGSTFQLIDVSNAIAGQTAANISVVATGNIAATNVQAALQELDTEKIGAAGPTFTGTVLLGQNAVLAFEGSANDQYETTITVTNPTADRTITFPNVTGNVVTTGDTGTVTSAMIADATIVNADVSATAEIAVSKLANGTARQLLQTDTAGTGVEFTSNVDVPGTLDVTGVATFDSTSLFVGNATFNGSLIFEGATPDAHELTLSVADPGADVTVTIPASTTTLAGLAVTQSFTKAQRGTPVALTDGATIAVDMSLGNNFSVTLAGNRSLGDPTNVTAGQSGVIVVTQDGTGSRTLAYAGTKYKFAGGSAVTLTTTAAAVDVLAYYCESATRITVTSLLNVS
ncbi:phage-related tail fiber protein [uncultured Mediterranean phage uvMED]|nr:phage-related tail fiber protein [uncultured Mediterranean phage uvMED]